MDSRTQARVERWESRPFAGGTDELTALADANFSGAVSAAGAWLFLLNGRVVGVVDGDIEDVAATTGTIYEAPEDVLPLLAAMLETGGETRGTYYTNETSLAEVDRTLQQGSFTGYVELSEQVLSGDYYAVYYGGRRMSAAYIGNAERLVTGEEAFRLADDEVGIYDVVDVDVTVTDIPGTEPDPVQEEPSEPTDDPTPTESVETSYDEAGYDEASGETTASESTPIEDAEASAGPGDRSLESPGTGGVSETDPDESQADATAAETDGAPNEPTPSETDDEQDSSNTDRPDATVADESVETPDPDTPDSITRPKGTDSDDAESDDPSSITTSTGDENAAEGAKDERFREEARWRETRQIPSIDPDASRTERSSEVTSHRSERRRSRTEAEPAQSAPSSQTSEDVATRADPDPDAVASTDRALQSDMLEREDKIDQLTQRVTELEETKAALERERDELARENESLTETIEALESQIESLEARLESSHSSPAAPSQPSSKPTAPATGSISLTPAEALAQTNVFVRYDSKSQTTLESAHDGDGSRADLAKNLQLERHTQFDANDATVDGVSYDEFIEGTVQYQFVSWLIETALFEIRETGRAAGLADLYDVIPRIDRVELDAEISLEDDDTENVPDLITFDVAAFDKRGTPLVVANCNDSRDPATRSMLESLEADASAVCANYPDLGGAVAVTSSFFDPGALELAEQATTSGFLSRSSKLSHVSLSRKQGYHFCLVESRSGGFHVTVPEL
ncbi:DUF7527 domain-containing protein [Halovivax gelatinilyticus]|uniref:DUF7527 domain-containing protein n=1 Tax=Halovivax gelatinilyticus TaxID=2961597 RepID=UPI0020CA3931|nr:hypothetical protein [Halovivax gelatinilyticus]